MYMKILKNQEMISMKNLKIYVLCSLFFFSLIFQGCRRTEKATETASKSPNAVKYFAPYTGEEVTKDTYNNIAIMTVVENSKQARPQSGLNSADIVFETLAEGGIPRFIALFQKNSSKTVGPIRSARSYFLDISKEYNVPFGHCGGSAEALSRIKTEGLMSMNEMANTSYFWRDNSRKAPHNLYTSTDKLRELAKAKGYNNTPIVKLNFDSNYWKNSQLPTANTVLLKVNKYYNTSYIYKDGYYYKSMDGVPSLNREDSSDLKFRNIIIQFAEIKLQEDGSHLDISLVGEGTGYVISGGKYVKMTWQRKDSNSQTIIKDENGKQIPLYPGNTWWHIIDLGTPIEIK